MDRGGGHLEAPRKFLGENKAPPSQALKRCFELVRKTHADHLSFGERLIFPIEVTERIELVGGLLRSTRLEQLIELRDHLWLELTDLSPGLWSLDGQGARFSTPKAHMHGNLVGFEECYVLDQQGQHPFSFARFGARVVPYTWEVTGQREDASARILTE